MQVLPAIQKLPTHYYIYVLIEFRFKVKEKFENSILKNMDLL